MLTMLSTASILTNPTMIICITVLTALVGLFIFFHFVKSTFSFVMRALIMGAIASVIGFLVIVT